MGGIVLAPPEGVRDCPRPRPRPRPRSGGRSHRLCRRASVPPRGGGQQGPEGGRRRVVPGLPQRQVVPGGCIAAAIAVAIAVAIAAAPGKARRGTVHEPQPSSAPLPPPGPVPGPLQILVLPLPAELVGPVGGCPALPLRSLLSLPNLPLHGAVGGVEPLLGQEGEAAPHGERGGRGWNEDVVLGVL